MVHQTPRSRTALYIVAVLVGVALVVAAFIAVKLYSSSAEEASAEPQTTANPFDPRGSNPALACKNHVVDVLIRSALDARRTNPPRWLTATEQLSFSGLEYQAFSAAMSRYPRLVTPAGVNQYPALDHVLDQVVPTIEGVCIKAGTTPDPTIFSDPCERAVTRALGRFGISFQQGISTAQAIVYEQQELGLGSTEYSAFMVALNDYQPRLSDPLSRDEGLATLTRTVRPTYRVACAGKF